MSYDEGATLQIPTLCARRPRRKLTITQGHTISQRLRTLKRIPPELLPLGVVLAAALLAAGYSMINKLLGDKTLRLGRQGPGRYTGDDSKEH